MFKILKKQQLAENTKLIEIYAPLIAKKSFPGQFVVLRINERGERIPLTIADFDVEKGIITIIFQEVGKTTKLLGKLNEGDFIKDFIGPLGQPMEIRKYGTVVIIGGGVGIAPIYPEARTLKNAGNKVIAIIGARDKSLLFWEEKMRSVSDELYITTDNGSYGRRGFVSDVLLELIKNGMKIDRVIAIGPTIMMKVIANLTMEYKIKTIVSLNPIMIDGIGMCGVCRVLVGSKTKFTCCDGPEFDAHQVDWNLLMQRQRTYLNEEKTAVENFNMGGING